NEYFWINTLDLKMVMHPTKPELNGKDLSEMKDPTGKKIFVEMVNAAKASGEGYVNYLWPKPGNEKPQPKTSYVKLFAPWGWILGNGVYADDVQTEISLMKKENFFWFSIAIGISFLISLAAGIQQLIRVILPVQGAIDVLTKDANALMTTAQGLTQSSEQLNIAGNTQASSVHQTATAMTQMNEMIAKTSESAKESSSLAGNTRSVVEQSVQSLNALNSAMQSITEAQQELKTAVTDNVKKMHAVTSIISQISEKTKAINDIVFQTKLLSFNASVEAARAGEYGKGFAVVAEEVGKLAQMSGSASVEISSIVTTSNEQVLNLTKAIESSLEQVLQKVSHSVSEGTKCSHESLDMLSQVVDMTGKSSRMAENISSANQEQAKGSAEAAVALRAMEQATQQMNLVVQKNDLFAEELSKGASELQDVINKLIKIVSTKETDKLAS
ncbi:MAG: methyl-accepting chemotaxis protein, partial [Bdellovibrio sp.]